MTVHQSIEKSDRAILRRIARESQVLQIEQTRLDSAQSPSAQSPSALAFTAQAVATRATVVETLREVALATGCAQRNGDLIVEALAGDDSNLWD